ncbi:E3 ubiquitin-protein ligase TRIM39-like [Penaeus indicus]|uniref:E3 ubiquitin-protein ligase TRIM39-like n=1 Tax=Penaeus indicus TaxID=29960 RepID=UPI00300C8E55
MAPKCSSCRGLFDSCKRLPLLLPNCGHTCCKACLVRLVQHRGYLCSICRTKQGISDVDALHVNHSLLEEILSMGDETPEPPSADETACARHPGVRLAFWCATCRSALCGECVVELHPRPKHQVARFQEVMVEMRRHVQTVLQTVIDDTEKAMKDCQKEGEEAGAHNKALEDLSQSILESALKLVLAATILESQRIDVKDDERKLKKLEEAACKMFCDIPRGISGWAAIKDLQTYAKKVDEFKNNVYENISARESHRNLHHNASKETAKAVAAKCNEFIEQVTSQWPDRHMTLGKAGGLQARLQYAEKRLHFHCPRKASKDETITQMKHWSLLQCLTTQAQVLVFVDLHDGEHGDTKRVYIKMTSEHTHSQHFLRLCAGHHKASFLNSALATRREDSSTVVVVLASLNGIATDKGKGTAPKELQKGDVVSISGEVTQVCVVMEARQGATLACTYIGKVTSGLDAVIKSNGNLAKGKVCVKDCGIAWQI